MEIGWKAKRKLAKLTTPSHPEHQYLNALECILRNGVDMRNRTGVDARVELCYQMRFDLTRGFPAVTTKKLAYPIVAGELIGFLAGFDSAADFRRLGVNIWNKDANENADWLANPNRRGEDDLGRVYGVQWRSWRKADGTTLDQLAEKIEVIRNNPYDRRIIVTALNPGELDEMALPPCHMLFQFFPIPETGLLHMYMYQRSCDMFLGVPFNIASYATLLCLVARITGYAPGTFIHELGNAHIYHKHFDQVKQQLARKPKPLPKLRISELITEVDHTHELALSDITSGYPAREAVANVFRLEDYRHHDPIKAEMFTTPQKDDE